MSQDIEVSRNGHVAIVEICRPPHNFFDVALVRELGTTLKALDGDKDCRAVVLAARGTAFCAGANFNSGGEEFEESGFAGMVQALYDAGSELLRTRKPIIAAVQGAAVGGGVGLALVADFRVASPSSRFTVNFTKIGIHPGFGLTVTLPRLVGAQNAAMLFLTGKRIGGEEALAMGLVDRLVPEAELRSAAIALANEVAVNAPLAVMSVRETLRQGLYEAVREAMVHERAEQVWLKGTKDAEEGIKAVSERRDGIFIAG